MENISILKLARLIAQKTQYQVSQETGICQTTISLVERGFREPTEKEVEMLAECYGLSREILDQMEQAGESSPR